MLLSGSFQERLFTDGSYDAEVITHEYAHGVTDRLVDDRFVLQGGAMSEAWSDFFALEFTLPEGAPLDGSYAVSEYLFSGSVPASGHAHTRQTMTSTLYVRALRSPERRRARIAFRRRDLVYGALGSAR